MNVLTNFLVVGIGGFAGAVARYASYLLIAKIWTHPFPLATLTINGTACLLAGFLLGVLESRSPSPQLVLLLGMGFLGSYSTFSTLALESFELLQTREVMFLTLNLLLNLVVGIAALWIGRIWALA